MSNDQTVNDSQTLIEIHSPQSQEIEIAEAAPIRLQTLDLARHAVAAPDGNQYVVATIDDTRLGNGYVTTVYPQQNGYLTLVLLSLYQFSSATPQEAMQRHVDLVHAIQQGRLNEYKNG